MSGAAKGISQKDLRSLYDRASERLRERAGEDAVREAELRYATGEDCAALSDRPVRRMLSRLGFLPSGRDGPGTRARIREACERIAAEAGCSFSSVLASLWLYAGGGPGGRWAVCGKDPDCAACPLRGGCPYSRKGLTMARMPEEQRPRERLAARGTAELADAELLAILLRTGTRDQTALALAQQMLKDCDGVAGLAAMRVGELTKLPGLGQAKAAQILAAVELGRRAGDAVKAGQRIGSALDMVAHFQKRIGASRKELFYAVLLDNKHRILREVKVSEGSLTSSIVHPREAFVEAVRESAARVLFVHNHPSGDPEPSREDLEVTDRLKKTGEILGIPVLDHVIVGHSGYVSFAERGLL